MVAAPSEQAAPPVVAVVVTTDPGWWLEECLQSLAAQDYPQLSVLVIDADSAEDPTPRVASVTPAAYVRRVRRRRGFGLAANEVLGVVEGASHYVFCHDDVALAPSAVRLLVEEAFRSNAGVVAPKLVGWFHPERLIAVGMSADGFGVPVALVERGELDQQQHDAVRDVFYAPAPCLLVRADLFGNIGGFDPAYHVVGEDLDLGWRVHLAGARVVTAPDAVVRHFEATETGHRAIDGSLRDPSRPELAATDAQLLPAAPGAAGLEDAGSWDLGAWDSEPAEDESGPVSPHHATRRARREAERGLAHDSWRGDDDPWDTDPWAPRRRPRRVAPAKAVARPPEAEVPRGPDADALDERRTDAHLQAVASNYGTVQVALRLALLLAISASAASVRLARGDREGARRTMRPWGDLLAASGSVRSRRKVVRKIRTVPDRDVAPFQNRGFARVRRAVRFAMARTDAEVDDDAPRRRGPLWAWLAVLALLGLGSRRLLTGHIPAIGEFVPWPSLHTLVATATSGWRTTGLGVAGPPATAFGLLAALATIALGHTTLLQHILLLGMIPLGGLGIYRLARPFESTRAPVVALCAYLVVPLPYNAVARGSWSGLVAYGAFPWILALLFRAAAIAPFGPRPVDGGRPPLPPALRLACIAFVIALASAIQPALLLLVPAVAVLLFGATLFTGARAGGGRLLATALAGSLGATVLLLPWATSWLPPGGEWALFGGAGAGGGPASHLATLLRFQTGPMGAGPLGYALLLAAALPLAIGRSWRSTWAVHLWAVALGSFGLAWAGQHAALGPGWPPASVLLAPAAVAIALSVSLGMAAFDTDLSGYVFGWRQVVSGLAATAAVLAALPVLGATADGRWHQNPTGFDTQLSWMAPKRADGDFRVLWIGAPDVLPIAGWRLSTGVAYATSRNGVADLTDEWPGTSHGTTNLLAQAIDLVRTDRTIAAGHLLAPMGVRYIVLVTRPGPVGMAARSARPLPSDLTAGLDSQLDLARADQTDATTVYENAAWASMRLAVSSDVAAAAQPDDPRVARIVDLSGTAVLPRQSGPTTFSGSVTAGAQVLVAEAPSAHWQLTVAGHAVARQPAFATSNLFSSTGDGSATLSYRTPFGWLAAEILDALAWLALFVVLVRARRRPRLPPMPSRQPPASEQPVPLAVGGVS